jgi:hypothetical protein
MRDMKNISNKHKARKDAESWIITENLFRILKTKINSV